MNASIHRFTVGRRECLILLDGIFAYEPPIFPPPADLLFAGAPREELSRALPAHGLDIGASCTWMSPYACLAVKDDDGWVLVDTGGGPLDAATGNLPDRLDAAGVTPTDIHTVVITHAHPDHIGGLAAEDDTPTFPNARVLISMREREFWFTDEAEERIDEHMRDMLVGWARGKLSAVESSLWLVEEGTEVARGVTTQSAGGHTPGHLALRIRDQDQELLHMGDAVLHPLHVEHPDWHARVDVAPQDVAATRRRLLSDAAGSGVPVFAPHFPFPGLGRVMDEGGGWRWEPETRSAP